MIYDADNPPAEMRADYYADRLRFWLCILEKAPRHSDVANHALGMVDMCRKELEKARTELEAA